MAEDKKQNPPAGAPAPFALKAITPARLKEIMADILSNQANKDAGLTATKNACCLRATIMVLQESGALHPALSGADGRKRVREMLQAAGDGNTFLAANASQLGQWYLGKDARKAAGELAD